MSNYLVWICTLNIVVLWSIVELPAQTARDATAGQGEVFLTKLPAMQYPPLARQAGIHGNVELRVQIRPDGSVDSVQFESGHPMLTPAATQSAQQAQFECRGCADSIKSYSLEYTFQFSENRNVCCEPRRESVVSQSEHHVTVVTDPFCFCDEAVVMHRARSAKCLYLWKCGLAF